MSRRVVLAAGHGEIGGGEVMLLACAAALSDLGLRAIVVAPETPGRLAAEARAAGHAVVTHAVGHGGAWAGSVPALRGAVETARGGDPRVSVWCHGLRPSAATAGLPRRIVHLHRNPTRGQVPLLAAAVPRAGALVVPSTSTRSLLPGPVRANARVLGNWTDDIAMTTRRHRSPDHAPVVGYLGRLAPEKGIEALVSAMELLDGLDFSPSPRLEVGGAPLFVDRSGAKRVERALLSLGDRVFHHGWVERSSFLASIDVLACPSTWEEPFGLVAAEAMAARVPVVVSDAGALPEVVGPEHPYTARAGDPRSLARVLHRALRELGTDAGDAVVGRARRRWEELWSPAAGRARVAELLADLGVLA